jgi:hypothetical protein
MELALTDLSRLENLGEDLRGLLQRARQLSLETKTLLGESRLLRVAALRAFDRIRHHQNFFSAGKRRTCVCSWRSALACSTENRAARKDVAASGAGIELDRRVAFHLAGERPVKVPPFSTCRSAANRLLRRLDREGVTHTLEAARGQWYCTWKRKSDGATIATGSGSAPALAVCRAVLNLDLGRIRPAIPSGLQSKASEALRARALETYRCVRCGSEISSGRKPRSGATCNPCSWRDGRDRRFARPGSSQIV